MRTLTIISHTEHYRLDNGSVVGLGATVTEINHLLAIFDRIIHVAMLHDSAAPQGTLPYVSDKIEFVALPAVGGKALGDKLAIGLQSPAILGRVRQALKDADYFQFRAPTGVGVFVIPYLIIFSSKKGWFKYAGNWKQKHAPWAYRFQKWCLQQQSRPVTINGFWEGQPEHCLSFENPCLTDEEIKQGQALISSKSFQFPIELCFVGRLETAKGVDVIIEALSRLDAASLQKISTVHFVGEGPAMVEYQKQSKHYALPIRFHGYLSRNQVHEVYRQSHAILLPSASEGFPKVVAEALNYGCIPLVSKVSSIAQYIKTGENGFLLEDIDVNALEQCLLEFLGLEQTTYERMKRTSPSFIERFSYAYYNQRLSDTIL